MKKDVLIGLLILYSVLCASILTARPDFGTTDLEEIKEIAAEEPVLVTVTLDNVGSVPVRTRPVSTAFARQREQRNDQIREAVLDKLEAHSDIVVERTEDPGVPSADADVVITNEFTTSTGFSALVTPEGVDELAALADVAEVRLTPVLGFALSDSIPLIDANDAWNRSVAGIPLRGENMTVCIIDSGIDYNHSAFAGRILSAHNRCFLSTGCPNASDQTNASDDNGHGTQVAGAAVGNGSVVGVAPAATVVAIKACNSAGDCYLDAMTAGVNYCRNLSSQFNISVISLSISDTGHYDSLASCPYDSGFESAVDAAYTDGIMVSIASGNAGGNTGVGYPSCIPSATSVGSTSKADAVSSFTQTGVLLDILAPGQSIVMPQRGGGTTTNSGTSFSTPHIAGVAAILRQNELLHGRTTLRPNLLEDMMRNMSGVKVSSWTRVNVINIINSRDSNLTINVSASRIEAGNITVLDFADTVDLSEASRCINFSNNNITVDVVTCPQFNKNATLQLKNLSFEKQPVVLVNGSVCRDCNVTGYSSGVFTFNVSHFTSYTSGVNSNLTIFDDSDSQVITQGDLVLFIANYSNRTSGAPINASSECTIRFNTTGSFGSWEQMTQNATNQTYYVNRTFTGAGNFTFQVRCNSTEFETLNATDGFNITADTQRPAITLVNPINGSEWNSSATVRFTFNVSDDGALQNCSIFINDTINATQTNITLRVNQTFNISFATNRNITWGVNCTDLGNNTNSSGAYFLLVNLTNMAPYASVVQPNVTVVEDINVTFNLSAIFSDAENDTLVYSAYHNGSLSVVTDNSTGATNVRGPANTSGNFSIVFVAIDARGALNTSNNITVNVTPVNDAPRFTGTISSQSWSQGDDKTSAFDLDNYFSDVDNSSVIFTSNGTSSITVTIDSTGHNVTFHPTSTFTGTEYATFRASDGVLNASSNTITLTVSSSSSSSSGGGGGGTCTNECTTAGNIGCSGTTGVMRCANYDDDSCLELRIEACASTESCLNAQCVINTCIPSWSCGDWSACSAGTQTRTCTDILLCNTTSYKPAESQTCTVEVQAVRPSVTEPLTIAENQAPAAPLENHTNGVTGASIVSCGDGQCSALEFCPTDCGKKKFVGVAITLVGIGMVAAAFYLRTKSTLSSTT